MIVDQKGGKGRFSNSEKDILRSKVRKTSGAVGYYKLSSEDQKIIVSINKIVPLIDQEEIAKEQHSKAIERINQNPMRSFAGAFAVNSILE